MTPKVGLVVNPVAGIGGPAGLKGSDGVEVQRLALARGGQLRSAERAVRMLSALPDGIDLELVTVGGAMGADAVSAAGRQAKVVWTPPAAVTEGADTTAAVTALVEAGASLVVFVGGDGTARDVAAGLGAEVPVLGVPAGVKMYSSCFAISPEAAAAVVSRWAGGGLPTRVAEVLDVDEAALRSAPRRPDLVALVRVPELPGRTQARKAATPASEASAVTAAALGAARALEPGVQYLMGPGGTIAEVGRQLGLQLSPLGVDLVRDGRLVATDLTEGEAFAWASAAPTRAVLTVIGGQGFLLGRGNQQLSARVVEALLPDPLVVVATEQKLLELAGRPLLVDTGDPELDRRLSGHVRVITGPRSAVMYQLQSAHFDNPDRRDS